MSQRVRYRFSMPPGQYRSLTVTFETDDTEEGFEVALTIHGAAVKRFGPIGQLERLIEGHEYDPSQEKWRQVP